MIRLRVFVSSTQKELQAERQAIGSLLVTDEFLRSCTVPRLFEEYPAPLQPNPKDYLKRILELAGHPPARFSEEHGGVTVVLEAVPLDAAQATGLGESPPKEEVSEAVDHASAILAILDEVGQITTASCVKKLGVSRNTAWRVLSGMVEQGILEAIGSGRGTRYGRKKVR